MKRGLHIAAADARQRGAEEGRLDAAASARHQRVRRTALPESTNPRALAFARALREVDVYGFGSEEDDVHVA